MKQVNHYLFLILVQILFGINFVISKLIVTQFSPILWAEIRFLISGSLLWGFCRMTKIPFPKLTPKDFLTLFFFSAIGFTLGQSLLLKGIQLSTANHAAIISSTIPIFALLIAILLKQEKLSFFKFLGFALSVAGILIIQNFGSFSLSNETFLGDTLILISCLGIGAYLALGKGFLTRFHPISLTSYFFLMAALQLLPFALHSSQSILTFNFTLPFFFAAFYSIIGATLIAYLLSNWVLTKLPSGPVALFTYLQPITAIITSSLLLQEPPSFKMILGTLLVFTGFFFTIRKTE